MLKRVAAALYPLAAACRSVLGPVAAIKKAASPTASWATMSSSSADAM
jgi:hypothetical protein